jgi:hypothetical protein
MRKYGIVLALLLIGACKGSDGVEPLVTTSVQVSSTPNQISVNETAQASAIVKDQNGNPLTGKNIAWTSLNPSVATVNPTSGQIRGVSPGNATIQGTVEGVTGTATITVLGVQTSCSSGVVNVDLQPGEARAINARATGGCIKVAQTAAPSSYVLIAANENALPDVVASFGLKSDEGENIPAATLLTPPYRFVSQLNVPDAAEFPGALQAKFERKLRLTERRELNFKEGRRLAQSLKAKSDVRYSQSVAAIPVIGDKATFKVPVKDGASGGCSAFTSVTATVKFVSTRAIIYLDDASPANGFTDTDYQEIATEFDNLIYPTDVSNFGAPLDQDNNARVDILYTPQVNKLTPAGSNGFVGGFFFVGDFFPTTGPAGQSCAQSNLAEIFYVLAPDPAGTINSNQRSTSSVRQGTRGTIAHEFQHMINASEHWNNQAATDFESVWLDEALSHTAEDLNGRALKSLNETSNLTFGQIASNIDDFNAFFYQNFARFRYYLANTGQFSPTSAMADTSLAVRGAAWALVRYTMDQYAPNGDTKAFLKSLTPGPDTGVVNLTNHAGGVPFDTLATGWMIANYADDAGVPNLPVKYSYKSYNMRDNVKKIISSNPAAQIYPLQPSVVTGSGVVISGLSARSTSGVYFQFSRGANGLARTFRMLSSDLASAANFTGATLIVLRTQ